MPTRNDNADNPLEAYADMARTQFDHDPDPTATQLDADQRNAIEHAQDPNRAILGRFVRSAYAIQKMRVAMGNQLAANFRSRLGLESSQPEDEDAEASKILDDLRASHKRIADGLSVKSVEGTDMTANITARHFKKFTGDQIITTAAEFALVDTYVKILKTEEQHFAKLTLFLDDIPVYKNYLKSVKGVGPAMAGILLTYFNPHRSKYVSGYYKYSGLDVVVLPDGTAEGRSRRSAHLVDREYTAADGSTQVRKSLTYTPFLKTKLLGVLGTSFLRTKSPWAQVYYNYKHRLQNHPAHKNKTAGHINRMAIRYMVKAFLYEFYCADRNAAGLQVYSTYGEDKLALFHGHDPSAEAVARNVAQQQAA